MRFAKFARARGALGVGGTSRASGLPYCVSVIVSLLRRLTGTVAVARLLVVVLLAVFAVPALGGACCGGFESAEAAEADGEKAADACCQNHADGSADQAPCSCPFPCSSGCGGYISRLFARANGVVLAEPIPLLAPLVGPELAEPANPEPRDILHVPKRRGA